MLGRPWKNVNKSDRNAAVAARDRTIASFLHTCLGVKKLLIFPNRDEKA